jgi:hypothetical protein
LPILPTGIYGVTNSRRALFAGLDAFIISEPDFLLYSLCCESFSSHDKRKLGCAEIVTDIDPRL